MATEPKIKAKLRKTIGLTPSGEETIMDLIIRFICDEAGAPALEYALILAFLGVALIGGIGALGGALNGVFISITDKLVSG